jgi:hypothetical protein
MTIRLTLTVILVLCCSTARDLQAQQRPSHDLMVRILESTGTPADVRMRVLREVRKIEPHDREPVLVNYIREQAARWQRDYDAGTYQGYDDGDPYAVILGMLADDHDPAVIPLLVGASHISLTAAEAAADFGEDALDEAITVVNTDHNRASSALYVIELMLERKSVRKPLSPPARARVTALIEAQLRGSHEPNSVALAALDIAAKIGVDHTLLARVKQLVEDERAALEVSNGVPMAHPEIHLIPVGYAGFVTIAFMTNIGQPGDFEGNARLYRIPAHGMLFTQSPPNHGSGPERQFFIVEPNGDRHPVKISISTLDDTPHNRAHPDIEIFALTRGSTQGERCSIEYDQYFVGTRAQYLDADSSEVSKRLEDTFKCP